MVRKAGSQKLRGRTANFCDPASSNHHNSGGGGGGGGFTERKKVNPYVTAKGIYQPTHRVSGASIKAPGYKPCHKLGSVIS